MPLRPELHFFSSSVTAAEIHPQAKMHLFITQAFPPPPFLHSAAFTQTIRFAGLFTITSEWPENVEFDVWFSVFNLRIKLLLYLKALKLHHPPILSPFLFSLWALSLPSFHFPFFLLNDVSPSTLPFMVPGCFLTGASKLCKSALWVQMEFRKTPRYQQSLWINGLLYQNNCLTAYRDVLQ